MEFDAPALSAISALIAAIVGGGTWWLTKNGQRADAARGLIADALTVQKNTHSAYEEATEELEALRRDIHLLRDEVAMIRDELDHWRTVSLVARNEYKKEKGHEPIWWIPFSNK